ncbi:hypothetical protein L917_12654, partial [Phytophthora nicotianae]
MVVCFHISQGPRAAYFGAVTMGGADLIVDTCVIYDLSFPRCASENDRVQETLHSKSRMTEPNTSSPDF